MAVSSSFYRNVFLLNQLVPPSEDFKKLFREGMFDKPNIAGFLYVSHYLLTIYDAERFKKLIEWPIICKKSEAKYRNDIKDYLNTISLENPDIGFPRILATYLHHASGTKFTIIMWKLSQLAIKKYIICKGAYDIISAPKLGPVSDLTRTYLQQSKASIVSNSLSRHRNCLQMEEIANSALLEGKEKLAKIKTELFDKKQVITKHIDTAPVGSSIKQCLANVEDTEIIQMWKNSLDKNIQHIQKQHAILEDLEKSCEKISEIIPNISNETKALDAKQLKEINCSLILGLSFPPDVQHCLYHLYSDNKLVFYNFIHLFTSILCQLHQCLRKDLLMDLSQCLLQIEASIEDMKSVCDVFKTFLMKIISSTKETQNILHKKNAFHTPEKDALPLAKSILLMSSPLIQINTHCAGDKNDLHKLLQITPREITYKSLFSRYMRDKQNHAPEFRTNLLVSRINIDDTVPLGNNEKQSLSRFVTPKINRYKKTGKYSRLFSMCMNKTFKANCSTISLPSSISANSSVNAIDEIPKLSNFNMHITERDFFNTSEESFTQLSPIKQSISEDKSEETSNILNHEFKVNKPELDELTEIQFINNDNKDLVIKHEGRKSIGDLVERYKKLLDDNKRATIKLQSAYIEDGTE